jgi:hypothetical protein
VTIKFICSCGKHLRARDEMAARRSFCPRCGQPVGIPSLKPNLPGAEPPMTPLERMRLARQRLVRAPAAPPEPEPEAPLPPPPRVKAPPVRLLSKKARRQAQLAGRLEQHWQQCIPYPMRAWRLCFGLALFLSLLSIGVAVILPPMMAERLDDSTTQLFFQIGGALLLVVIAGMPCSFLECVLTSAVEGEVYYILWSGNALSTLLLSGVKWVACFLAGPVLFAGIGYLYWLNCGEPARLDWFILAELGTVAFTYWIFALLAVTDRGWLRGINPLGVADAAYRMGWRGMVGVIIAAVLLQAHGLALIAGVVGIHGGKAWGWLLLLGGWVSAVYWSTFFCRFLGIWCHRSRVWLAAEAEEPRAPVVGAASRAAPG